MAHENLDVNSDQVNNLAEPYQYAASDFSNLSGRIDEIWARYKDAWGHDSIGAAVAPSFEQGFQYLQGSAKALHETMHYYSDGLSRSGKVYGESEENAAEGGRQLDSAFQQIQTPSFTMPAETSSGTPFKTARRMEGERLEPLESEEEGTPRMRLASRSVRPEEAAEGRFVADDMPAGKVFMRSERRVAEPLEDSQRGEPLQPLMRAERVEGQLLQPRELDEAQPLMRAERVEAQPAQPLMRAETVEGRLLQPAEYTAARPAIPAGAVIDPSIPPDSYGPCYRLPDGSILAHPAESARIPVTPTDS
jgi:hypothetical protein